MKGRVYRRIFLAAALSLSVLSAGCSSPAGEAETETAESVQNLSEQQETEQQTEGESEKAAEKEAKADSTAAETEGTVIGTLEELTAGTATILSDNGNSWTFDTSAAEVELPSGIRIGNLIAVDYSGTLTEDAEQNTAAVRIVGSFDVTDSKERKDRDISTVEGTLSELTLSTIKIKQADGQEITFSTIHVPVSFEHGLYQGMTVTVEYTGTFTGTDATADTVTVEKIGG